MQDHEFTLDTVIPLYKIRVLWYDDTIIKELRKDGFDVGIICKRGF
ncbi:hypothetical protein [Anaerocolumna xylanovorans]|nr:hypothetical protein [Anaerocolumna xylanovorans]